MAYSDDLRQKLLSAVDTQPLSKAALARTFGVSLSYLKGIVRRQKAGNPHALPHAGGPPPKLDAAQRAHLRQHVTTHADATLAELQVWLQATCQVTLSLATLCRVLQRMELPRKKDAARHGTRHGGPPAATGRVAHRGRDARPRPPGLCRRKRGDLQHDPPVWACAEGRARARGRAAGPLGSDHADRRARAGRGAGAVYRPCRHGYGD